jgi:phosphotransferase system  glucose/maltose/N-acetylglucosamine-specific IIC component
MKIKYKGVVREFNLAYLLMNVFFYLLILAGLIWAIVDTNEVGQVTEGNLQYSTYGVLGFDRWYTTFFFWIVILVFIGAIYIFILKIIKRRYYKSIVDNDENTTFNKGDKERDVSACDYRKWSK